MTPLLTGVVAGSEESDEADSDGSSGNETAERFFDQDIE